ncbi:MAG: hypothetical protein ACT4PE_05750 [Candidatus Eiseniibacteriota bacterium]
MDRLAIAGIALGLVIGVIGLARGRDALTVRAQAVIAEAQVATAQRDVDRLRSAPSDPRPLRALTDTLVLFDRGMVAQPTPLRVRTRLESAPRRGNPWAPLTGETVTITMQTDVSPMAAVAWLDTALQNHTVLLTGIQWDGRTGTIRAVALGP